MANCPKHIQNLAADMIQWAGERMSELNEDDRLEDLYAIYEEWYEWIEEPEISSILLLDQGTP